ncbi:lipoyl(octanoyl) transferase LipB [Dietzia massiliensis]|uniref:lipoyl(octanoyl) transferase LipB n=1 Tax=Dietzia massiliensis TaxID=2697499 RepID=UPI001BCC6375|nr:lipoyl(octanoyl) transferase LipB [Dietzia massiliensis]MBS7547295.1 lipoyl(octanoyl) transferase LipB [Dietzia massiliensis]
MSHTGQSLRRDPAAPEIRRLGTVEYSPTWDLQRTLAEERADGRRGDTVLLLEHPATYTAGKRTEPSDRPVDGTPVVDVDRGGRITWHGPGQLVGYPIIALTDPIDVVEYVRRVEQALITTCARFGVEAGRVDGRSGVWCAASDGRPERKVAAIGIRVQRGVTMHGFSLNCDCDLTAFSRIVPCGIVDAGVTSLTAELGRTVTVSDVLDQVNSDLVEALDGRLPVS